MLPAPGVRRRVAPLVAVAALAVAGVACGDDGDDAPAAAEGEPAAGGFAADNYTTDLSGVCPETVSVQTGWFPQPERGPLYQLIGAAGTTDAEAGTYTGPLGATGIDLEVRIGGPFVGDQSNMSILYQDDELTMAEVSTDEAISVYGEFPTVSVVTPLEISPRILMWDPETHPFESLEDVGESGIPVLVFGGEDAWVQYLIGAGTLTEDQIDESYDGSPSRFATEQGGVAQQGYVTNEPFEYENTIDEWGRPVDYALVDEAGFRPYDGALAVRSDRLEELSPCLEELVPIMQQAVVDYAADPTEVNDRLIEIADELASYWELNPEGNEYAVETMKELEILGNGSDGTVGNFDEARVQELIDQTSPIFERSNSNFDPGVAPGDIVTNEFVDPEIAL